MVHKTTGKKPQMENKATKKNILYRHNREKINGIQNNREQTALYGKQNTREKYIENNTTEN